MSKKSKKNVPQLRFSQFQHDWFIGTLQDCIKQLDAGVSVNSDPQESIENEKGVLKTSCVSMGEFEPSENKLVSDEYERTRLREAVTKDTIIICRSNTPTFVGTSAYIDKDYPNLFLSDKLWAAKIKKKFSPKWVSYLLLQGKNRTLLCLRATGTSNSMKNISKDDLLTLTAYFPTQEEQEKIASFLGAVDTRLTQLRRQHELLQTYKRGVMQKLFSQQIRFKGDRGKPFPDWEKKKLGQLLTIRYGKDHKDLEDGNYPVLGTGGIMRYVNSYLYDKPSILIGRKGTINKPQLVTYPFWTVDTLFYSEISPDLIPYFIFLVVQSINWQKYNEATGVPSLNTSSINNVKVIIPPEKKEQAKIANFLTAIDKKIEAVAKQIDLTEQFKKGLLQKMFV